MNPVLKYRGGKSREIPRFVQYIPNNYNRYIEPFLGGGAVYFYLEPENAILNDLNVRLMTFYTQLRNNYPLMRQQLDVIQHIYEVNQAAYRRLKAQAVPEVRVPNENEELYYQMRELFNHPDDTYLDGVLYFFINKTAYSGMIRYNNNGEYNVPFGRYPNLNTHLITQQHSDLLQNAELFNLDYRAIFDMAEADDFIFLDPPYRKGEEERVLRCLSRSTIVDKETLLVVEAARETAFDYVGELGFIMLKRKEYKTNQHVYFQRG